MATGDPPLAADELVFLPNALVFQADDGPTIYLPSGYAVAAMTLDVLPGQWSADDPSDRLDVRCEMRDHRGRAVVLARHVSARALVGLAWGQWTGPSVSRVTPARPITVRCVLQAGYALPALTSHTAERTPVHPGQTLGTPVLLGPVISCELGVYVRRTWGALASYVVVMSGDARWPDGRHTEAVAHTLVTHLSRLVLWPGVSDLAGPGPVAGPVAARLAEDLHG